MPAPGQSPDVQGHPPARTQVSVPSSSGHGIQPSEPGDQTKSIQNLTADDADSTDQR